MSKKKRKTEPFEKLVYIQLARLNVDDFVAITDVLVLNDEKVSKRKKQWLSMLNAGKLTCAATDKPVAYLSYDVTNHKDVTKRSYHFNFYTENDELLTVDHVYPKSLGGSEMDVDNLQPMIGKYNWEKGSTI